MFHHWTGRAPVPREHNRAAVKHGADGAREIDEIGRIEPVADHTSQTGDTENSLGHAEVLTKVEESKGSKRTNA
jgi:hypothetical protein